MQVSVAVYTFVAAIFAIFVLWGTKNLGLLGLLSAFAVGMISYSFSESIEIGVATIILAGILIKFLYPYIQRKWSEGYANYTAEETSKRITGMQNSWRASQKGVGATGLAPTIHEGFQNEPTMAGAVAGMPAMGATQMPAIPGMGATQMPAIPGMGAMPSPEAVDAAAISTTGTGAQTVMMPNLSGSGAIPLVTPPKAPAADMSDVQPATMTGSEPAPTTNQAAGATAQQTVNGANSMAAPATGTAAVGAETPAVTQAPTQAFTNPTAGGAGMFKLGELPSAAPGGPHIDAGTTIMRALGALNTDQIGSLTDDTRKLLDTQKSLMNMLTTMKPMLSDGQNLLASFTNMFGKQ